MRFSLRGLFGVMTIAAVFSFAIANDAQYTGLRGRNKAWSDGTHVWTQRCRCDGFGRKTLSRNWHCNDCGKAWEKTAVKQSLHRRCRWCGGEMHLVPGGFSGYEKLLWQCDYCNFLP